MGLQVVTDGDPARPGFTDLILVAGEGPVLLRFFLFLRPYTA
jgi:hypothetical protein